MSQLFTTEQMLGRWEDLRELKNLMGCLSADYVLKREKEMFDAYWSNREDVCLGVNEGYYAGAQEVRRYYKAQDELIALESRLIQQAFPEELKDKSPEEIYGVGMIGYKPVDTPVIEIAEDGETAKGLWSIRGSHSGLTPGGPQAFWEWGWFAVDFVRENDAWRIWHMLYLQEVMRPAGSPWTGAEKQYAERSEFAEIKEYCPPMPFRMEVIRERYHAGRKFTQSPRIPEPYETFGKTFSYGI